MSELKEEVVLFHGILRSNAHMRKMAAYLRSKGYIVHNLSYPSTRHRLEKLADLMWEEVSRRLAPNTITHFVGYSMGGLLIRTMLTKYRPEALGRVVLLAAPNKGSEVADWLKDNWLYKTFYGPAGQQLTTCQSEAKELFGCIDYEVGCLSGNVSYDPICGRLFDGDHDGKVSVESAKIEGMKDHLTVRAAHSWFPQYKEVAKQTAHFLQHGEFLHTPKNTIGERNILSPRDSVEARGA